LKQSCDKINKKKVIMSVPYHKDRGKLRLTPGQVAGYAKQAGFEDKDIPTIVGIATAESGLDPYNLNPNRKTGDESYGLMQINMIDYPDYQLGQERLKSVQFVALFYWGIFVFYVAIEWRPKWNFGFVC
jgi:hypothetical protein